MERVRLGRTGLAVGAAGLGCGGRSRLGRRNGKSRADRVALVQFALDQGINLIDTAAAYGTEKIVGAAIVGRRDSVVLSTKLAITAPAGLLRRSRLISGEQLTRDLEGSLRRLRCDYVDILHLHAVLPDQYDYCVKELVPALLRLRDQGKVRYLGLTERFRLDPQHRMLGRALADDCWDVIMVGFNLINPSARERVFARTREHGVGTLVMYAVRRALSDPTALTKLLEDLGTRGLIDSQEMGPKRLIDLLTGEGGADGLVDGAYRFCRREPGVDVVLTGTGSREHLHQNVRSLNAGPLAPECLEMLRVHFGAVDSVSGN